MLTKLRHNFSSILGLLLLGLCLWVISTQLREYNYQDVLNSLRKIPRSRLSLSIWLTALSYLVMVGYDILGFKYVDRHLSFNKVAFTNFISATFSNTIGLALLTGSAIRYRFYSTWGISALEIAQIVAFENISFWLGMLVVAGIMFILYPIPIPTQLHLPFTSLNFVGVVFLLVAAIYLLGSVISKQPLNIRGHEFRFPSLRLALAQIIISSCDWILVGAVFYVLLPPHIPWSYLDFLGIYLLAMFAGVVSNVPGGLGVFETVVLLVLAPKVSAPAALGSLLAYRAIYYFLPLTVAVAMWGLYEFNKVRNNADTK